MANSAEVFLIQCKGVAKKKERKKGFVAKKKKKKRALEQVCLFVSSTGCVIFFKSDGNI